MYKNAGGDPSKRHPRVKLRPVFRAEGTWEIVKGRCGGDGSREVNRCVARLAVGGMPVLVLSRRAHPAGVCPAREIERAALPPRMLVRAARAAGVARGAHPPRFSNVAHPPRVPHAALSLPLVRSSVRGVVRRRGPSEGRWRGWYCWSGARVEEPVVRSSVRGRLAADAGHGREAEGKLGVGHDTSGRWAEREGRDVFDARSGGVRCARAEVRRATRGADGRPVVGVIAVRSAGRSVGGTAPFSAWG